MSNNRINKVAIVGATGNIGSPILTELLKLGRHEITAITRQNSNNKFPEGVKVARVDYSNEESIVTALRGHDFLVISLGTRVAPEVHPNICNAAVKAGVNWIMPNAYGMDPNNEVQMNENVFGPIAKKAIDDVKAAGGNFIQLTCGFWYEWSLGGGLDFYGFDIKNRKVVFFDDGNTKLNSSTMSQCGRAVAAFLSLPIVKEDAGKPALEDWKNNALYVSSFLVSQRDMLDSVHRALGTEDKDWKIEYEVAEERVEKALEEMKKGNFSGFAQAMYTQMFYKKGSEAYKYGNANYEAVHGLANEVLGLPQEDLDKATKMVVDQSLKDGWAYEERG